ncbi:MAG: winged helix-turn-helix transcriptional regulator [Alkalispirochaeta sp.]
MTVFRPAFRFPGEPPAPVVGSAAPSRATGPAHLSQRSIAQALGMSVGPTNAILKRLTDKGFLMMRRINAHNVHYLVTPAGLDQISRRSYLYLRRTIGHVVRYKERLREFCRQQHHAGVHEIVLIPWSVHSHLLGYASKARATSPSSSSGAPKKEGLGFRQVEGAPEGEIGKVERDRVHGRAASEACDQAGSAESSGSEGSPIPDRGGDAVVYILSELHPEATTRSSSDELVLLHEIALGNH